MQEKRHHKRFIVAGMDIHGRMIVATEVSVRDISISGISLKADRRLNIGSDYVMNLVDGEEGISVSGTVVWSSIREHRDGSHGDVVPIYTAGLKFTNLVNDKMTALVNFIEERLPGDEQRLGGQRVMLTGEGKAILDYPSGYRVKKLSLGGMLVESAQEIGAGLRFPMELSLPDARPIRFSGRVTSCRLVYGQKSEHFDIGIAFVNMPEKDIERVKEFISLLHRMENIS